MQRLWSVLDAAHRHRGSFSTAQLVERAWRSLGGDAPLREDELTNARRYFELLDEIEGGAGVPPDAVELERRLQRLYAEPQTFGPESAHVELLTMHRAKGLEWDVVLLPALERWPGRNRARLLTWAELSSGGSDAADGSAMMLAPIAARGEEVDGLTRWLKRKHADQEAAERKRLFYVAATRAREELHLFASPDRKESGEVRPAPQSLLRSAWAAAEHHFAPAASLESVAVARLQIAPETAVVELAAAGSVVEMPRRNGVSANGSTGQMAQEATEELLYAKPMRPEIVRLPESFRPAERIAEARSQRIRYRLGEAKSAEDGDDQKAAFSRPEGSVAARSVGNAIHALLELIADRIAKGEKGEAIAHEVGGWRPRIAALLRGDGISPVDVDRLTREAVAALTNALHDRDGQWVLAPHPEAGNEYALVGPRTDEEGLYSIRVDRTFLAGIKPHAEGRECLWIVDYKAASHGSMGLAEFLDEQRSIYAPQLEGYARILARERGWGLERVRVGLYYPALPRLVWWVPAATGVSPMELSS